MKRLKRLAQKSSLLDINIKINNELIKFNLLEELEISPKNVNQEIMEQPSHFAFLSLAMVKAKTIMDKKRSKLEGIRNSIFTEYKDDIDKNTGRPYSNDLAEAYITEQDEYREALKEYQKSENEFLQIKTCVDAFQQRKDLLQSLSANIRQEKNVN